MAKNVRIVPASGSIFFTADNFDVTGSIRLQTVGSTEDVQFIDGKTNDKRIAYVSNKGDGPFGDCEWTPTIKPGEAYF